MSTLPVSILIAINARGDYVIVDGAKGAEHAAKELHAIDGAAHIIWHTIEFRATIPLPENEVTAVTVAVTKDMVRASRAMQDKAANAKHLARDPSIFEDDLPAQAPASAPVPPAPEVSDDQINTMHSLPARANGAGAYPLTVPGSRSPDVTHNWTL